MIRVENLIKKYDKLIAVDDISFSVNNKEMFALIGPDGTGKTTTIRIICGLLKQSLGKVFVFDKDINLFKKQIQRNIGYLSQKFSLYLDLSVKENIKFFAQVHDVDDYQKKAEKLLEITKMKKFENRLAENLSGGMKQKLALICSLIHNPKIIFLDEPTTGVDPVSRRDFWDILSELQQDGMTVFMSSPYLDEAERCTKIALLNKGKLIAEGSPENLKNSIKKTIAELTCEKVILANNLLKDTFDIQIFGDKINIISDNFLQEKKLIEKILFQNKIKISDFKIIRPSLENVFIHLIKNVSI